MFVSTELKRWMMQRWAERISRWEMKITMSNGEDIFIKAGTYTFTWTGNTLQSIELLMDWAGVDQDSIRIINGSQICTLKMIKLDLDELTQIEK